MPPHPRRVKAVRHLKVRFHRGAMEISPRGQSGRVLGSQQRLRAAAEETGGRSRALQPPPPPPLPQPHHWERIKSRRADVPGEWAGGQAVAGRGDNAGRLPASPGGVVGPYSGAPVAGDVRGLFMPPTPTHRHTHTHNHNHTLFNGLGNSHTPACTRNSWLCYPCARCKEWQRRSSEISSVGSEGRRKGRGAGGARSRNCRAGILRRPRSALLFSICPPKT